MPLLTAIPNVSDQDLARHMGKRKDRAFSRSLSSKIILLKKKLHALANPVLSYRMYRVETVYKNGVELEGNLCLKSSKLARTFNGCKEVVCFLGTIGTRIEKEIVRLMGQRRLSDAYVLDVMGSVTTENMVAQFYRRMKKLHETDNKTVTYRFSPGYCDWSVTDQKPLFRLLDAKAVGVQLTDSCLMQPRKSISGVFGIYPHHDGSPRKIYNPCLECRKKDCQARRN